MLKKTIKYTDFNGNKQSEDFYFNLTKAEIAEMEMSKKGGLSESIKAVVEAEDTPAILKIFKKLILDAHGVKSEDGRRFIKTEKSREEFAQTEAYSELFVELASDSKAAAKFVNSIIPAEAQKALPKEAQ
jgi:hypothetical protein